MKNFHEIGHILDMDCLTSDRLEVVANSIKKDLPYTASQSILRTMIFNDIFSFCGKAVMERLDRRLTKEEVLFIARRIDFFLTARGYD